MTRRSIFRAPIVAVLALLPGLGLLALQPPASARWITAWGTAQSGLGMTTITNATVRMIARVTISGEAVRIRLDNTYGTTPLRIGRASVGHRVIRETLATGSSRQVFFNQSASVTIPAGGTITSDPVKVRVLAHEDLAVSLYVPEANVRPSQHGGALVTSYLSANGSGDATADEVPPPPGGSVPTRSVFSATTTSMFWLKSIDVLSSSSTGAIVAIGDSITDGSCATVDGYDRWPDWLGLRLSEAGIEKAVVNSGIGGNTITRENLRPAPNSDPALERFDRDVLSHHGVTHVILFEGTNDIRRDAPAAQVMSGMQEIVKRVKARGIKIIAATIIPRHNYPPAGDNTGWNPAKTKVRHEVNQWIRKGTPFDGVVDFDKAMRDPKNPELNYPSFHCDGIHPSSRGYYEVAKSIPLDLFKR